MEAPKPRDHDQDVLAQCQLAADSVSKLGADLLFLLHEVRSSLQCASLDGSLLEDNLASHPDRTEDLELVLGLREHLDEVARLVDRLASLPEPDAGELEQVDLGATLARLLRTMRSSSQLRPGAALRLDSPEEPVRVVGRRRLLEQALYAVLRNAVEAVGADGRIDVTVSPRGARAAVVVQDDGPGPPAELGEDLLAPHATTKPGRLGLGLAVASRILADHGGALSVTEGPGGGTSAEILLPREQD